MNRRPGRISTRLMAFVATLAVGAGAGAIAYESFSSPDTQTVVRQVTVKGSDAAASTSTLTIPEIYQASYKSVVEVTVTSTSSGTPFGGGGGETQQSQGSGFVYDSDGNVVTNEHVVDGAESVSVRFWNGGTYKATVVGSDPSTDLAMVKVDAPESLLAPLELGDSGKLLVGDGVIAIGSPFGLEDSVTSGIVSALHRQMQAPNNFTINDSIQTDAAINHGNSGGPLLNAQGQVIGVNAQIRSESGGSDGVGFAIPSNTIRSIATQLIADGKVEHAYLGVSVQTVPATAADELDLVEGVELVKVTEGTPAAKAGLRSATGTKIVDGDPYRTGGDVITEFDGETMTTSEQLQRAVDSKRPGDTVSITYWRDGKSRTADVKLATRPGAVPVNP